MDLRFCRKRRKRRDSEDSETELVVSRRVVAVVILSLLAVLASRRALPADVLTTVFEALVSLGR